MKPLHLYGVYALLLLGLVYICPWLVLNTFKISSDIDSSWALVSNFMSISLSEYRSLCFDSGLNYGMSKILAFYLSMYLAPTVGIGGFLALMFSYNKKIRNMEDSRIAPTWASMKDIDEFLGNDGVVLTDSIRLQESQCYEHIMVVGPTGSGKTASYFMPNILSLKPHQSTVIFDPKGEIYQNTANFHRSQGRDVVMLKLDDEMVSACWNPLDLPKDMVQMAKICKSIIKNKSGDGASASSGNDDLFNASAEDLMMALIYIVKYIPPMGYYGTLANMLKLLSVMSFEAIIGLAYYTIAEAKNEGIDLKDLSSRLNSFSREHVAEDTRNSTKFVLKTALAPFLMDSVAIITSKTTFRFESLKEKPTALFISMPEHKVDGVKPVLATLYMQLFDAILDHASIGSSADVSVKKRPIFFFLDEFANCGKILGFTNYIATIRSRQMSVSVCLQSPDQLNQSYSDAEKNAIINNLKTVLILPGLKEQSSLKFFSELCGKVAYSERDNMTSDLRVLEKDRVPISSIRELEDNSSTNDHEAIVILKNKPAIKDKQKRYYLDRNLKSILKNNPQSEFARNPEKHRDDVKAQSFLENQDIHLLELIGTFIYYHGQIDRVESTADKSQVMRKLAEFSNIASFPAFQLNLKLNKYRCIWSKAKDSRAKLAQIMVTTAFHDLMDSKIMTPPMKN